MKQNYFYTLFVVICMLGSTSCSKEQAAATPDDFEPIGETITMTRAFTIYSTTRADVLNYELVAVLDTNTDRVLRYKIQQVEGELRTDLDISQEELDRALAEKLGPDFTDLVALEEAKTTAAESFTLSGCLRDCREEFTNEDGSKKPGRGACKFACWVDVFLEIFRPVVKYF